MRGVKFGNIHSWDDLELILEPFTPPPAIPKTNLFDNPAGDGSLDFTEALGVIRYHDRELVFNFTVDPYSEMTFDAKITQVSNALNGKAFNITLDREPEYYWEGRCIVNEHLQDKMIGQIVVKAIVRPYKLKHTITEYEFRAYGTKVTETVMNNGSKPVVPEIRCESYPIEITFEGETHIIDSFYTIIPDLQLKGGANEISILYEGNAVSNSTRLFLEFREGDL